MFYFAYLRPTFDRYSRFFLPIGAVLLIWSCRGPNSGEVAGPEDQHCVERPLIPPERFRCVNPNELTSATPISAYGKPLYNNTGNDDDCKYRIEWNAKDIKVHRYISITLKLNWLSTGAPVRRANTIFEAWIGSTPYQGVPPASVETGDGTYTFKDMVFHKKGDWQVRFHFFHDCANTSDSLHGHVTFYVHVN
jgi:hypothetical protein